MEPLLRDLRYGIRSLRKAPGFTAVAVLTLALGIGANTTMFSVVSYALLRAVPYAEPQRLVWLNETSKAFPLMSVSYLNYLDWRAQAADVFEELAAVRGDSFNLTGSGEPERVQARMASGNFFAALRVTPLVGRAFTAGDDKQGAPRTAILGHSFWKRRFNGDPTVVGRSITLSGDSYTVVGILRPDFRWRQGEGGDLWVPIGLFADRYQERGSHPGIWGVGRLKPGTTVDGARAALDAVSERLQKQYPDNVAPGQKVTVRPFREVQVEDSQTALLVLWGATALVLLIAAANVANLMLARAAARQGEMAVRVALGAGKKHLIRQLLAESVVLSVAGGLLGAMLSVWGVDALAALMPTTVPRAADVTVDGVALAFTLAVSLATGIGFGLFPALRTARSDLHGYLKEGRASADPRRQRLRSILVVSEVALALVLLIGAGLLLRSFREILHVRPGFRADHLLTLSIALPARYARPDALLTIDRELRRRISALPGVDAVAVAGGVPFLGAAETSFTIVGRPPLAPGEANFANIYPVTPGYLEALGIRLVKGRFFDENDGSLTRPVLVIDDALAKKSFPNQDPLGQRFKAGGKDQPDAEIVGVVEHVLHYGLDGQGPVDQAFYVPWAGLARQAPQWATRMGVTIRTRVEPLSLAEAARKAVLEIDPELPVYNVQTMETAVANSVSDRRFSMLLLSLFAAVALLLSSVGIYGVMSYSVTQRTREMGIRLALGAQRNSVLGLVVGQAARMAAIGLGLGLLAAFGVSRAMASMLYGVTASDPATYAAVAAVLGLIAVIASWLPARRATRVDPIVALRAD